MDLTQITFHPDINRFLYYADSPLKNYEYSPNIAEQLGICILSGNVETGFNIYSEEDPSVLYTKMKVIKPNCQLVAKVPSYPRYRALNPYQRYEYLQFLMNPYQGTKNGYLYLLLYCLERRLYEKNESVIPVIKKLADYHGGKFSKSVHQTLRRYELWKKGQIQPTNARVFNNYTLRYIGCYDDTL